MLLVSIVVCFSAIFPASLSISLLGSKPKPVKLKHSCMTIIPSDKAFKPDNVPIILLHGMGGNKESWEGLIQLLALETKKKVCAADLRNHGESPFDSEEYDVEAMTEDVKDLIDQLNVSKAIVLGHSLGGKIAVHLSLNYPERVEKIIVEDMRPNGISPEALKEVRFIAKMYIDLEKYIPQGLSEKEAKTALFNLLQERQQELNLPFKLKDPSLLPIKCSDGKCQWKTNNILMESLLKEYDDIFPEISGVFKGPALFIYGGKSSFKVGDDESNIKKLFPNAKLVEVPEARHMVHKSEKFKREVIKFINEE